MNVELSISSKKFLKKCEKSISIRILQRINELAKDPFPKDAKRIVNRKEKVFRVRIGDYRILYSIIDDKLILFIIDIDKRSKIYM